MSEKEKEVIILSRDTFAMLVPSGARVMLHKGTEVEVTQALGNSFTVNVYGNLMRIDGKDADSLGKELSQPVFELMPDATIEEKVWAQLQTVFDPEIPVNIVDLGLIYAVTTNELEDKTYRVHLDMTLTAPGCGMGPVITADAHDRVMVIPEVTDVQIELVFDPPWTQDKMSDMAKLELGMF